MDQAVTNLSTTAPVTTKFSLSSFLDGLLKRLFDLCASLLGLLLLALPFTLLAALIRRESPGPVFYRGLRLGRGGRLFRMLKFRSMYECPQSYQGPPVTAEADPRVTPLGRWLRLTKLNELPQLWNVLIGQMSLVGPRPEDPAIVAHWPEDLRGEILSVRPGITSPASVLYRREESLLNHGSQAEDPGACLRDEGPGACLRGSGGSVMDDYFAGIMPDKLRLDRLYVHNRSFLGDLDLVFLTLIALLPRLKHFSIPESTLHWGPLSRFISRYFSWFLIDNFVTFTAVGITGLLWRLSGPLDIGLDAAIGLALAISLCFSLVNACLGLGSISWRQARPACAFDLALSSGLTTLLLLLLDYIWYLYFRPLMPPGMLLVTGLLAFLGFLTVRYRDRLLTGLASRWLHYRRPLSTIGEPLLIVGAGEGGQLAVWLLRKCHVARSFAIVGMLDDDPRKQGLKVEGCTVLGATRLIPELVAKKDVGLILYAISNIDAKERERILALCRQTSARLVLIPDLLQDLRRQLFAQPEESTHEETLA